MASLSTFCLENGYLRFGNVDVPVASATSFWVKTHNQIEILGCQGKYHTMFCLHLQTPDRLHQFIHFLLSNTQLAPSILSFRNVKPLVVSEYGNCSIRFTFTKREDLDFFVHYFLPLIPDCIFVPGVFENDIYFAQVTFNVTEPEIDQVQRINSVFKKILGRYQKCGINPALKRLGDKRFPSLFEMTEEEVPDFEVEQLLDHFREYDVHEDLICERIGLPNEQVFVLPVKTEEIQAWMANPESFAGKQKAKYMEFLTASLRHELSRQMVDNHKIKPLLNAALSFDSFDLKDFIRKIE